MFDADGNRGPERGITRIVAFAQLHARRRQAEAVVVRDILNPVKPDFASVIVVFRDRRKLVSPDAHDQPMHLAGTTLERRRPGRGKRRGFLSIGQEQEIGLQFARHLDRAEETRRDTAVALPGHAPIESMNRGFKRRVIGARLDRLKQKKGAPFGENPESNARSARKLSDHFRKRRLDELQPTYWTSGRAIVACVHAAGDIDDDERIEACSLDRRSRRNQRKQRERQSRRQKQQPRIAEIAACHGRPLGTPGASVQSFLGSA